jgi:hypothetical protein
LRVRVWVEELEPRALLASSLLAGVAGPLATLPAPVGPALAQISGPVVSPQTPTVTPPAAPPAMSGVPVGGTVLSAPVTSSGSSAAPGNTPGTSSVVTADPSPPFTPLIALSPLTPATTNGTTPSTSAVLANAPTLATTPETALPPTSVTPATAIPVNTFSPVGTVGVTFLGVSGVVVRPFAVDMLALAPLGPGPTITAPNGGTNAPLYFDTASHRLLFVVGGPEVRNPEDAYLMGDENDDFFTPQDPLLELWPEPGALQETPRGSDVDEFVARPEPVAAAEPSWPQQAEAYFAGEVTVEEPAGEVPALGAAESAAPAEVQPPQQTNPAATAELLSAAAALGLLNGTRWQKELERENWPRRRRTRRDRLGKE